MCASKCLSCFVKLNLKIKIQIVRLCLKVIKLKCSLGLSVFQWLHYLMPFSFGLLSLASVLVLGSSPTRTWNITLISLSFWQPWFCFDQLERISALSIHHHPSLLSVLTTSLTVAGPNSSVSSAPQSFACIWSSYSRRSQLLQNYCLIEFTSYVFIFSFKSVISLSSRWISVFNLPSSLWAVTYKNDKLLMHIQYIHTYQSASCVLLFPIRFF